MILNFRPLNSWLKLGVVLTTCCDEQNFEQPGNKTSYRCINKEMNQQLGGGFKYFLISSLFGENCHFD